MTSTMKGSLSGVSVRAHLTTSDVGAWFTKPFKADARWPSGRGGLVRLNEPT